MAMSSLSARGNLAVHVVILAITRRRERFHLTIFPARPVVILVLHQSRLDRSVNKATHPEQNTRCFALA
jgi:hypothetical protein